ncbi:Fungal specific transcription factor domain-containing protein [Cladophialophora immunda]|nr:Fungal specific transcription factor domain-containing protein [Cladophialophora immunda]
MDTQPPRKRKRSAIACTRCHDRKVRCSLAFQGIPCANCAQDGTTCKVYGQQHAASVSLPSPGHQLGHSSRSIEYNTRPDPAIQPSSKPVYPLTPSPASIPIAEVTHQGSDTVEITRDRVNVEKSPARVASPDCQRGPEASSEIATGTQQTPTTVSDSLSDKPRGPEQSRDILVPYYAGEAEGLEFVFDICSPNRSVKGAPYIISRNILKRQHFKPEITPGSRPLFPPPVCARLLRCFFSYVYPVLPVVNAGEFITKYSDDPNSVSCLLLWSVFFAAAIYIDADALKAIGFQSRKVLKQFCYQNAKRTYDAQLETDKSAIIASVLLLGYWYVDLEDLDGACYWIGSAIHLCFALWRRLWWCSYYRDAWLSLGTGRPMRVHLDDCDLQLPTVHDVVDDFKDLSPELCEAFQPLDLEGLAELWIKILRLSIKLEDAMVLHYRPRRPPLSLSQLETDYADISHLLDSLPVDIENRSRTLTLHMYHFKCYCQAVIILLHRSYILSTPVHLSPAERNSLQAAATQRSKTAAADSTSTLNRLIAQDMIETSPTMLVTAMMVAMQIHLFELARSDGLIRQHAGHNLNLHLMVLSHLNKTFWSADMHRNLFTEVLKALNAGRTGDAKQYAGYAAGLQDPAAQASTPHPRDDQANPMNTVLDTCGLSGTAFDEFFASFGPFDNFQFLFDEG